MVPLCEGAKMSSKFKIPSNFTNNQTDKNLKKSKKIFLKNEKKTFKSLNKLGLRTLKGNKFLNFCVH